MEIKTHLGDIRFLEADLLVAALYDDELPPRGLSGLVDWHTGGQVSALLAAGSITGAAGQAFLLATQGKIAPGKFLALGMGPRRGKGDAGRIRETVALAGERVEGLGAFRVGLELLGVRSGTVTPEEITRLLLDRFMPWVEGSHSMEKKLILIPADDQQLEAVESVVWGGL